MKKFKYKTTLEARLNEIVQSETENFKINEANKKQIAEASGSLKKLSGDMPYVVGNDLQGIVCNAAVINKFNDNDDGISTATALATSHWYSNKPINIEHDRKEVVGHIMWHNFREYETNNDLWDLKADILDPFYLTLSGVIYRLSFPEISELLNQASDENNEFLYKSICASWEVAFDEYHIAIGKDNNLKNCKVITPDNDRLMFETLKSNLKANGGNGTYEDKRVFRLIVGEMMPLGLGLTTNPAADVEGVLTYDKSWYGESYEDDEVYANKNNNEKNTRKISQSEKNPVLNTNEHINTMDKKEIKEMLEDILGEKVSAEKLNESVASFTETIKDAILVKDKEFTKEKEAIVKEKEALAEKEKETQIKLTEATESLSQVKDQLAETKKQLAEVQKEQKVQETLATFEKRMEIIDNKFELTDEDRTIVAKNLKAVDLDEESFASFQADLDITWSHKNKDTIAKAKEDFENEVKARVAEELKKQNRTETQTSTASNQNDEETTDKKDDEDVDAAMDNSTASNNAPTNTPSEEADKPTSLVDKFKASWKQEDNVSVSA